MASIRQILTLSTWARVVPGIKDAFIRFPLPFIGVIGASLLAMLTLHDSHIFNRELIGKILFSLGYGAVALTSLKLWMESQHGSRIKYAFAAVMVMAVVIWYAWGVYDRMSFSSSVYFASALVLSLLFAPYIKNNSDQPSVWYFNYQTGVAVFFAGLAALVLGVGIAIILVSLNYLFDIKIPSRIYGDVWILSWGALFPIYVLANLSRQFDFESERCSFPKGIRFITNYILLPLMVVYMAILYAYFARITMQWELPRGKLTWMIAVFGTVGIITKLLAYPIRNSGTRLLLWFDKYYYLALIIPIVLLAIAIGIRIHDYGMTERRYTVVLMAVWFTSVVVLSLYKRERFHIKVVLMILAGLLLLGSFGPWGAVDVSIRSQVGRFASLLAKYQLLQNGQAVKTKTDIPFAARKKLSSIAEYLCQNEARYQHIRPWFRTLLVNAGKKASLPCVRVGGRGLVNLMGINYVGSWQVQGKPEYISYNNPIFRINENLVDVSGYDYIGRGRMYSYAKQHFEHKFELRHNSKHETILVSGTGERMVVKTGAGDTVTFEIGKRIRQLRNQRITRITDANSDKLILNAKSANGHLRARLILEDVQSSASSTRKLDITFLEYILMLKLDDS